MEPHILKIERIHTELSKIYNYPLTLVVAAMGYGKTTIVRDFLESKKEKYLWLSVEREETSAENIWNSLIGKLAESEPGLGCRLQELGFSGGRAVKKQAAKRY